MIIKKKGVTLIELLAVVAILGNSMILIYNSYIRLREASIFCYERMYSIFITIDLMERMLITDPSKLEPAGTDNIREITIEKLTNVLEGPHSSYAGITARQVYPDFNKFKAILTVIKSGVTELDNYSTNQPEYYIKLVPPDCIGYVVALQGLQAKRPPKEMFATFISYRY
ncbi:MAG TPA: prepilin-type N-terminal cleavage/methylation domain-containing protein [bacterium]|nr:prepilin-type N-terminal cleavage/methylation domain-containing protein [bacterium]